MILLAALVFLFQDKSAESTFKKIEQKINGAGSISLRFKIETSAPPGQPTGISEWTGPLLIKEPRKVRIEFGGSYFDGSKNHPRNGRFVTDGVNVLAEVAGEARNLPKNLKSGFKPLLSHCGLSIGWGILLIEKNDPLGKPVPVDLDLAGRFTLLHFKHGLDDGDSKTLTYTLRRRIGGEDIDLPMKVWYDRKTLLLTKRTFVEPNKSKTTETYSEMKLGADIKEDKFEVPEAK